MQCEECTVIYFDVYDYSVLSSLNVSKLNNEYLLYCKIATF